MVKPARSLRLSGASAPSGHLRHVVIFFKENHGFDNYFAKFPGAAGDPSLPPSPNPPTHDPDHRHRAWLNRAKSAPRLTFPEADIPAYWKYARDFTLCDRYFTDVAGPSTPNHLMVFCAESPLVDNPSKRSGPGAPLYDFPSLPAQLDKAGLSWGNYGGYAFDFLKYTKGKQKPSSQFAIDAAAGKLPTVSWVYGPQGLSEHPVDDVTKGMQWTVDQVSAIVKGGLWPQAAVFITWDDWGGWYDHLDPPEVEKWTDGTQFRYGGRVPCLVLSPYAKSGFVSHALHSHVSLVRFCEDQFGLPSLNARTAGADGMADCFDFKQKPLPPPAP